MALRPSLVLGLAMWLGAFVGVSAGVGGCSSEESYRCDSTGCFDCDGLGCRPVEAPKAPPCAFAGDTTCAKGTVCTDTGCRIPCAASAECERGLVCSGGYCAVPGSTPTPKTCTVAKDCPTGASCIDGACVATPPCTDASCTCKFSSDCGAGRLCVDGACARGCDPLTPCAVGFTCSDKGICTESATPTCGGLTGKSCKSGERCVDGRCSASCAADTECLGAGGTPDATLRCVGGACVPDTRTDPKCAGDTECVSGSQKCLDGFCRYLCSTDDSCRAVDARIGTCSKTEGICRSPADLSVTCTKKSDCEATKSCVDGKCL